MQVLDKDSKVKGSLKTNIEPGNGPLEEEDTPFGNPQFFGGIIFTPVKAAAIKIHHSILPCLDILRVP